MPATSSPLRRRSRAALPAACLVAVVALSGSFAWCGGSPPGASVAPVSAPPGPPPPAAAENPFRFLNRLTWGASAASSKQLERLGRARYLDWQLHPPAPAALPPDAQAQIDAMTITRKPADLLALDLEKQRREADQLPDEEQRKSAQQAYQQEMNRIARETATRFLLRALYSPDQLREQLTWFWMNHFSVHSGKHNLRVLTADYEERAIRPNALGRFRDLLAATVYHPAMLRYLDNEQNALNHTNENYARELMELHTMGVGGGYTQRDVQELARVLSGVGVNMTEATPKVRPELAGQYVRQGVFEFNPNRHDYGDKVLLGHRLTGRGLPEVSDAIDLLAGHPATARFVSRKLAAYFLSDAPPESVVRAMAETFSASGGDIAATLARLFDSQEFAASLGTKFKDPLHYVLSGIRFAYDEKPILNAGPIVNWLSRMGEPLYGRQTPDGYPLDSADWASPGQMNTRFEIAKAIGSGSAGLFKTEGPQPTERAAFPQLSNALYYRTVEGTLGRKTLDALDQAVSSQEWNTFLLASPDFMYR